MKNSVFTGVLLCVATIVTLPGCGANNDESPAGATPEETRTVDDARSEAEKVSSQILDTTDTKGEASQAGPRVSTCEGAERGKLFTIFHPWSLKFKTDDELRSAAKRLKTGLPKQGWEIVTYGHNNSKAKSLELTADHKTRKFSVNIEFWESNSVREKNHPMLLVNLTSACFQVPDGQKVTEY